VRFEFGDADGVSRPFVLFRLVQDASGIVGRALVDTGSAHTVLPASFAPLFGDSPPVRRIPELRLGGYVDRHVPEYEADMLIVSVDGREAVPVSLPVLVTSFDLPFPIFGDTVLRHVVLVVRAHEDVLHVQTRDRFADSPHFSDESF
jgi:predicted aspartyl protease